MSGKEKRSLYEESKKHVRRERSKIGAMLYSLNRAHGVISLYGKGYDLLLRTPSGIIDEKEIWDEYHMRKRDLERMRKRGFVYIETLSERLVVKITNKGYTQSLIENAAMSCEKLEDGSYCVVSYDIPEYARKERDSFRRTLRIIGFEMLHKSTWVAKMNIGHYISEYVEEQGLKDFVTVGYLKDFADNSRS